MTKKIKVWLQKIQRRKREIKEQQTAATLIERIEQALKIELYNWQRLYIITGIWQPPKGRQQGRTLAYILRLLLDKSKPLLMYEPSHARVYADNPFEDEQYTPVPWYYTDYFTRELIDILEKLRKANVPVREVVVFKQDVRKYKEGQKQKQI